MKNTLIIIGFSFLSGNSFGQFMSYLTQLDNSDKESAFAEITLIHRDRQLPEKFINEVGTTRLMIPKVINGREIKINHSRFRTTEGYPFIRNNKTYIQVFLYYTFDTIDPRDDIFILSLPFEAAKELIDSELRYYQGEEYFNYNFVSAKKD